MASFYDKTPQGIILRIKLNPKAKQNNIAGLLTLENEELCLKVNVTAIPEDNKANKALIKLLSSTIGVAKSNFEIITGKTSKNKKLLISGESDFLENKMKALMK